MQKARTEQQKRPPEIKRWNVIKEKVNLTITVGTKERIQKDERKNKLEKEKNGKEKQKEKASKERIKGGGENVRQWGMKAEEIKVGSGDGGGRRK